MYPYPREYRRENHRSSLNRKDYMRVKSTLEQIKLQKRCERSDRQTILKPSSQEVPENQPRPHRYTSLHSYMYMNRKNTQRIPPTYMVYTTPSGSDASKPEDDKKCRQTPPYKSTENTSRHEQMKKTLFTILVFFLIETFVFLIAYQYY